MEGSWQGEQGGLDGRLMAESRVALMGGWCLMADQFRFNSNFMLICKTELCACLLAIHNNARIMANELYTRQLLNPFKGGSVPETSEIWTHL